MAAPVGEPTQLSSEQAAQLFERNAFLIVNDLPRGSHLTIDALESYLTDSKFQGVKLIPPGWHLFAWSGAASATGTADDSNVGLRTATFRYFEQQQVIVRRHDKASERWLHPDAKPASAQARSSTSSRKRLAQGASLPESTLTSQDHLRALDPQLAPYPLQKLPELVAATRHLQSAPRKEAEDFLAQMLGVDTQSGDFWTDALAEVEMVEPDGSIVQSLAARRRAADKAQKAEEDLDRLLAKGRGERYYGKDQAGATGEMDERAEDAQSANPSFADEAVQRLRLPRLDVRRSWPQGTVGADLTRWSIDKSWLLQDLAHRSAQLYSLSSASPRTSEETLAEWRALHMLFELVFFLWYGVQNSACLSYWSDLVACFCSAPTLCGAPGSFEEHPALKIQAPAEAGMQSAQQPATPVPPSPLAIAAFTRTLRAQLALLPPDFFTSPEHAIEGMQDVLVCHLSQLRRNIARGLAQSAANAAAAAKGEGGGERESGTGEGKELGAAPPVLPGKGPAFIPRSKRGSGGTARGPAGAPARRRRAPIGAVPEEEDEDEGDAFTSTTPKAVPAPREPSVQARAAVPAPAVPREANSKPVRDASEELLSAWRSLSHLLRDRFAIDLDAEIDEEVEVGRGVTVSQTRLREGASLADELELELEEGEDAPVIVEL